MVLLDRELLHSTDGPKKKEKQRRRISYENGDEAKLMKFFEMSRGPLNWDPISGWSNQQYIWCTKKTIHILCFFLNAYISPQIRFLSQCAYEISPHWYIDIESTFNSHKPTDKHSGLASVWPLHTVQDCRHPCAHLQLCTCGRLFKTPRSGVKSYYVLNMSPPPKIHMLKP